MTLKQFVILAMLGALIGLLASGVETLWQQEQPISTRSPLKQLPAFSVSDMKGNIWHSEQWTNKILVINFWATWCPPCREEMPLFSKLQEEYADQDVLFVGIAIDDQEAVQDFVDGYGIEFTVLLGDTEAIALSERMGNRFSALPFTVVADKGGKIIFRHAGGIKDEQLRPVLTKLGTQ